MGPMCPWDERTCSAAAYEGHLEVLQWVRAQDSQCPWSRDTCKAAVEAGHLDVLQWVRAHIHHVHGI